MTILLPEAIDGLEAIETALTRELVDRWLRKLEEKRVRVALPKFVIDPPESLSLADLLKRLGMPLAFDRTAADLTGIANPSDPADRLYLGDVFHKVFVKVDEKGTEAAAATAVTSKRIASIPRPEEKTEEFTADHPVLFLLRHTQSGVVLFVGRVGRPDSASETDGPSLRLSP